MERYLLALDLDGTACNDQNRLGGETKKALAAARAEGHIVCFATGRRDVDMVSLGKDYLQANYLLLNNGGKLIHTEDGQVLFNRLVNPEAAKRLILFSLAGEHCLHLLAGMYWAVNRWTAGLQEYVDQLGAAPVLYTTLEEAPYTRLEGLMATGDWGPVCRFIDQENLPLQYIQSEPTCTDIMDIGVNKWEGLRELARQLEIPQQRIIAAGDYYNDIEMIAQAGIGIAVSNALPEVKAVADYITPNDNNHDAAAHIVRRFLLRQGCG